METKELNKKLTKIANENGFYIIPKNQMEEIYKSFDFLKSENKRLMKRNKELREMKK